MTTKSVQEIANEYGVGKLVSGAGTDGGSPNCLTHARPIPRHAARDLAAAYRAAGHEADDVLDGEDDSLAWVYVTPAEDVTP